MWPKRGFFCSNKIILDTKKMVRFLLGNRWCPKSELLRSSDDGGGCCIESVIAILSKMRSNICCCISDPSSIFMQSTSDFEMFEIGRFRGFEDSCTAWNVWEHFYHSHLTDGRTDGRIHSSSEMMFPLLPLICFICLFFYLKIQFKGNGRMWLFGHNVNDKKGN